MLRNNLIANYLGQGWRSLMSLAFLPLYIDFLGLEAYGLIAIFGMLQAFLILLDMGLKPALGREMARYSGGAHDVQSIWNLLRAIETIAVPLACLIALSVFAASGWLAENWVNAEKITHQEIAAAFSLMGMVAALQFIQSVYASSIGGLQKQVLLNVISSSIATIRSLGAIVVLFWFSATIEAFFIWQAIISLLDVLISAIVVYKVLPPPPHTARFSWSAVMEIAHFAGGRVTITLLGLLLTYLDKIILLRLIPLEKYGVYALAGVVSGTLLMLVGPVTSAYFPRFVELLTKDDKNGLRSAYHQSSQIVSVILGSVAVILMIFAERIILLWTGDAQLAAQVAPFVVVLSLGSLLNGLFLVPLQMQFAYGRTSLIIRMNIMIVALVVPALFLLVPEFGPMAAAWIWVVLNMVYMTIGIYLMHRRIAQQEKWKWYCIDLALPLTAACLMGLLCQWVMPDHVGRLGELFVIVLSSCITIASAAMAAPIIRHRIRAHPVWAKMIPNRRVG